MRIIFKKKIKSNKVKKLFSESKESIVGQEEEVGEFRGESEHIIMAYDWMALFFRAWGIIIIIIIIIIY